MRDLDMQEIEEVSGGQSFGSFLFETYATNIPPAALGTIAGAVVGAQYGLMVGGPVGTLVGLAAGVAINTGLYLSGYGTGPNATTGSSITTGNIAAGF